MASHLLFRIRLLLGIFVFCLVISGATAIPLEWELRLLVQWFGDNSLFSKWFHEIQQALTDTNTKYPYLAYGTDWLAFAHFVIAVAFIGPFRNPVRNIWVIEFGMIACILVIPFAFFMGGIRGIPMGWRLIDCSFGVFGILPLWWVHRLTRKLEALNETQID